MGESIFLLIVIQHVVFGKGGRGKGGGGGRERGCGASSNTI